MKEQKNLRENKMGTTPIGKLLFQKALPMILSKLVQALYNVVDSIYVSQISESAITALSLAFPIQNLQIGCATGIAVGVTALLSKSLGCHDYERANKAAMNGIFLTGICVVAFMLFGAFAARPFYAMQSNVAETVEGGAAYIRICTLVSIGIFGEILFERLLQSSGRTSYTLITQGTGAVLNILLDPVFIFGKFGIPAMGIAGAAVATVLGQCVAFALALFFNAKKNHDVKISFRGFRPQMEIIRPVMAVAVPSVVMMSVGSVMNFGFNQILQSFSETATSVFGVYFKLQSFVFMPVFGLNNAMIPMVAFNFGARQPKRIVRSVLYCMITATCIMILGFLAFRFAPDLLLSMFNPTEQFLELGVVALRTISISFPIVGMCIVLSAAFQALGNGVYSTLVSIARQLVVLLPVAYLLSKTGDVSSVWWSFPISELISTAASVCFALRLFRQKVRGLYEVERLSWKELL